MPVEDMIRRNETGVWRLLRYLGMVDGPVELVDHHVWFRRTEVLRSPATGVWHPAVERGQFVAANGVIGHLTDLLGDPVAEIRARRRRPLRRCDPRDVGRRARGHDRDPS